VREITLPSGGVSVSVLSEDDELYFGCPLNILENVGRFVITDFMRFLGIYFLHKGISDALPWKSDWR
jgi:hypothetical protein